MKEIIFFYITLLISLFEPLYAEAPSGKSHKNIEYAQAGGKPLLLDLYESSTGAKSPVIVWIHGGGWYSGSKENPPMLPMLKKGYAVVSINYRLTDEAPFPAQIYDCKAAIRWVRKNAEAYGIDPQRIGVVGFSAGGHLAALLGTTGDLPELEGTEGPAGVSSRVQAVVDGYGPVDFKPMLQEITLHPHIAEPGRRSNIEAVNALLRAGSEEEKKRLIEIASPVHYVRGGVPPFYIFHGTLDKTVPVEQSQVLEQALKAAGNEVTLDLLEGQGHGIVGPLVGQKVTAFFDEKLK